MNGLLTGARSLQLQNNSSLPIQFSVQLDSVSCKRWENQQQLPQFLASPAQRTEVVGELAGGLGIVWGRVSGPRGGGVRAGGEGVGAW